MHNHIGCICSTFLHCAFLNVSSNRLHQKMQSHIGCICLTFLHCVFSNVSSNCLHQKMHSHIGCICLILGHCQLFSSGHLHSLKQSHNFPFVWLPLWFVLCPNDCFKLSQIFWSQSVKFSIAYFPFLATLVSLGFEACELDHNWAGSSHVGPNKVIVPFESKRSQQQPHFRSG